MTGTGRRNGAGGRRQFKCSQCGAVLALIRPEMIVLRRLIVDLNNAESHFRVDRDVHIRCRCGRENIFHYPVLQL